MCEDAACTGTWTYFLSVATGILCLRCASRSLGLQKLESLLAIELKEAMDAMDARDEVRLRGVFASYWVQGMSLFWFALGNMILFCG